MMEIKKGAQRSMEMAVLQHMGVHSWLRYAKGRAAARWGGSCWLRQPTQFIKI